MSTENIISQQSPVDHTPREQADFTLSGDSRVEVFQALSSEIARSILNVLDDSPKPVSAVAERINTSIQNVCHHIERLEETGLIESVDTRYSVKGKEMTVYALAVEEITVDLTSSAT